MTDTAPTLETTPEQPARDTFDISRLLAEHQFFHDSFQLERVIVGSNAWTPWAAFRQTLREVRTRFDALKQDYAAIEQAKVERDELEFRLRGTEPVFARRRMKLAYEQTVMKLEQLESTARDRAREFAYFISLAEAMRKDIGEVTPERRAALDLEAWATRLRAMAAEEVAAGGRPSAKTLGAIRLLPATERTALMKEIDEAPADLVAWWLAFEPVLPAVPPGAIAVDDVERMITCQSQ